MKDPAEYNAYVGAEQQTDDAAKISGFEAFLTQYPNSSYKEDALELLMIAYQKTNNQPKMLETAQKVLAGEPVQPSGLGRWWPTQAGDGDRARTRSRILADAGQTGEKGLQCLQTATKPEGTVALLIGTS